MSAAPASTNEYAAWLREHLSGAHLPRPPRREELRGDLERLERKIEQVEARRKYAPSNIDLERIDRKIEAFEAHAAKLRGALAYAPDAELLTCRRCGVVIDPDQHFYEGRRCRDCLRPPASSTDPERT
jgi:hypothetical protein